MRRKFKDILFKIEFKYFLYRSTAKPKPVLISGRINGPKIEKTSNKFTVSLTLYDARLADTDNVIARREYKVTSFFPMAFHIRAPASVLEEPNRYALSVTITDKNKKRLYLTDSAVFLTSRRSNYLLNVIKI